MVTLGFIFQSSVAQIQNEQFMANCPMPLHKAIAQNVTIDNNLVTFSLVPQNSTSVIKNTLFVCEVTDPNIPTYGVSVSVTEYSGTLINDQIAWVAFAGESITAFFERAGHQLFLGWLFIDAPAQVTGFQFFTVINAVLFGFFGLGMFMVFRG